MTREQALQTAKATHKAYRKALLENLMGRAPHFDALADYGFRHGWYTVGEFSFSEEEVSGVPYDITQGGWAYL